VQDQFSKEELLKTEILPDGGRWHAIRQWATEAITIWTNGNSKGREGKAVWLELLIVFLI
jgi:hypothetical protein